MTIITDSIKIRKYIFNNRIVRKASHSQHVLAYFQFCLALLQHQIAEDIGQAVRPEFNNNLFVQIVPIKFTLQSQSRQEVAKNSLVIKIIIFVIQVDD